MNLGNNLITNAIITKLNEGRYRDVILQYEFMRTNTL